MKIFLSAADLLNYLYCPRIIYYVYVLKRLQSVTVKERKGREKFKTFKEKSKRVKIIRELPHLKKIYDLYLNSEKYQFHTTVDCIAINEEKKEAYPIQIKYSFKPKAVYRGQRFQLTLEAFLIEENLGYKVPFGFIKYLKSNDFYKVNFSSYEKNQLLDIFNEIINIISKEYYPPPTKYKKRCLDCCFRLFCWGEEEKI